MARGKRQEQGLSADGVVADGLLAARARRRSAGTSGTSSRTDGRTLVVTKIGASPFPADPRPCVVLARPRLGLYGQDVLPAGAESIVPPGRHSADQYGRTTRSRTAGRSRPSSSVAIACASSARRAELLRDERHPLHPVAAGLGLAERVVEVADARARRWIDSCASVRIAFEYVAVRVPVGLRHLARAVQVAEVARASTLFSLRVHDLAHALGDAVAPASARRRVERLNVTTMHFVGLVAATANRLSGRQTISPVSSANDRDRAQPAARAVVDADVAVAPRSGRPPLGHELAPVGVALAADRRRPSRRSGSRSSRAAARGRSSCVGFVHGRSGESASGAVSARDDDAATTARAEQRQRSQAPRARRRL